MPLIHVKSLPFDQPFDVSSVVEGLTTDFAKELGIALEHVTATWEFLLPGHYAVAGKAVPHQPKDTHPILVEVLAPDFHSAQDVEKMLTIVASSLPQRAGVHLSNIFVIYRPAYSGRILDAGEVVRWSSTPHDAVAPPSDRTRCYASNKPRT